MKLRPTAALLFLLGVTAPAEADSSWVLILPPLKASGANTSGTATDQWHAIVDAVDRQAPVTAWQPDEVFAGADACEDARLAHLDDFDVAMTKDERAAPSGAERERLTNLARHALSRCVPALARSKGE